MVAPSLHTPVIGLAGSLLLSVAMGSFFPAYAVGPHSDAYRLSCLSSREILPFEPIWILIEPVEPSSQPAATQPRTSAARDPMRRLADLRIRRVTDPGGPRLVHVRFGSAEHAGDYHNSEPIEFMIALAKVRTGLLKEPFQVEHVFSLPGEYLIDAVGTGQSKLSGDLRITVRQPNEREATASRLYADDPAIALLVTKMMYGGPLAGLTCDVSDNVRHRLDRLAAEYGDLSYGQIAKACVCFAEPDSGSGHRDVAMPGRSKDQFRSAVDSLPKGNPLRQRLLMVQLHQAILYPDADQPEEVLARLDAEFPLRLQAPAIQRWRTARQELLIQTRARRIPATAPASR